MRNMTKFLPRPAMIIAVVALIAALGGTATAASGLISGKKIKPNTITSKQIKNRSIKLVDIQPKTVKKLRGAKGERGPAGPQGPQGEPGPAGVVNPLYATDASENIGNGEEKDLTSVTVEEAGRYIIQAKTNLFANGNGADVECYISDSDSSFDEARWTGDASDRDTLSLMAVKEIGANKEVSISCRFSGTNGSASSTKLVLIPVS